MEDDIMTNPASNPMTFPPYVNEGDEPPTTPEVDTWTRSGVYVEPTPIDLGSYTGGHHDSVKFDAPAGDTAAEFQPPSDQLSEEDTWRDRFATSSDVDHHIYPGEYHGPSYGELGPRPFPQ